MQVDFTVHRTCACIRMRGSPDFGAYQRVPENGLLFNRNGQRLDRFAHAMEQPLNPALSSDPVLRNLEALETRRPKFAPVLHPTLQTGIESLVVAARAWLPG